MTEGSPSPSSASTGQEIKLKTNSYQMTLSVGSVRELFFYKVIVAQPSRSLRSALATLSAGLFPSEDNSKSTHGWNSMVFDGCDLLLSAIGHLDDKVSDSSVTLDFLKKILLERDILLVAKFALSRILANLGYCRCDDVFYAESESKIVGPVRVLTGVKPHVMKIKTGLLLTWSLETRFERNETLFEFLQNGVKNFSMRPDLEAAVRSMSYVIRFGLHQRTVHVALIEWEPNDQRSKRACESCKAHFGIEPKSNEPFVELTSGEIYPSSMLVPADLTAAEKADDLFMDRIRELTELSIDSATARVERLMSLIRSHADTEKVLSFFGLTIGENIQATGAVLERPKLIVRDRFTKEMTCVEADNHLMVDYGRVDIAIPPILNKPPLILCDEMFEMCVKDQFLPMFLRTASEMGVVIKYPSEYYAKATSEMVFIYRLKQELRENGLPSIIIVIADTRRTSFTGLRMYAIHEIGIPIYFIQGTSLERNIEPSLVQSFIREMVVETGGVTSYASLPLRSTICMGVTSVGDREFSVSASFDHTLARYRYDLLTLEQVHAFLEETIAKFKKYTSFAPTRLVIYALTDGDAMQLYDKFSHALDTTLKITFFTVEAASSLRFMEVTNGSLKPASVGTVVYGDVTNGANRSFFLCCDDLLRRGYGPTKYTVHESDLDNVRLAQITLGLVCNLREFSKGERYPAPLVVARENLNYCHHLLKEKTPAPPLKEGFLHFLASQL